MNDEINTPLPATNGPPDETNSEKSSKAAEASRPCARPTENSHQAQPDMTPPASYSAPKACSPPHRRPHGAAMEDEMVTPARLDRYPRPADDELALAAAHAIRRRKVPGEILRPTARRAPLEGGQQQRVSVQLA